MIARLRGEIVSLSGDVAVMDVNGVGYELTITRGVYEKGVKLGSTMDLIVYTDVKENSISLFGFASSTEREVFLLLRKVKGIGPKMSLAVVSTLGAENVLRFIGQEDVASIQKVSGVGRKSAERIVVELREEVGRIAVEAQSSAHPIAALKDAIEITSTLFSRLPGMAGDAVLALEKLGFSAERARTAVQSVVDRTRSENKTQPADAGEYLRRALAEL